jgi:hypothetical protein
VEVNGESISISRGGVNPDEETFKVGVESQLSA